MVNERLSKLRLLMQQQAIDAYIIPSSDFHQSEYVGDYFKSRAYISGFTGSAGLVVITKDEACLWTDGRYFNQAAKELVGSEYILQREGEKGVPTPIEYLEEKLQNTANIGFDGRCVSVSEGLNYVALANRKQGSVTYQLDLIDSIWNERPALSKEAAFLLTDSYTGENIKDKLCRVRQVMQHERADIHIMSALDDICWLLNIRGNDVKYSPLVLSYIVMTQDELHIFIDEHKITAEIKSYFSDINYKIHPYEAIYAFVKEINDAQRVLIDPSKLNYALHTNIPDKAILIERTNPVVLFKSIKNSVELDNIKQAHILDGIAWVKFMKWLKENIGKIQITEVNASDKLESFRKEQEGYLWPSFAPISGYADNAAIVHYSADVNNCKDLQPKGLYLSDTGGNYYFGTTDITRTLALGPLTKEETLHYTLVLKSHIQLSLAKFLKGTCGYALDILARKPLWEHGLNFNHGTGHGVGYLLNVHEGPAGIRYKINPSKNEQHPIESGMVITNEPGIYIDGSHGIRIENEMIARNLETTAFGEFMNFETCTYVPYDLAAIDQSLLTSEEINYINQYHTMVFDILSPYLKDDEKAWLAHNTRTI